MNWVTLYISGRKGFKEEVDRKLLSAELELMPGYESGTSANGSEMYWIKEGTPMRAVKEAIGSKLIWKYRLRLTGEQPPAPNVAEDKMISLSDSEKQLVTSMRKRMRKVA